MDESPESTPERGWHPNMMVPPGTRIVLRPAHGAERLSALPGGAVGVIVQSPADVSHSYRIRLMNGDVAMLRRGEFSVLKLMQRDGLCEAESRSADSYEPYIVYRCIIGSRAYGLDNDSSDVDRRGIFLPPADWHWSIYGVAEQLELDPTQECYWELQKFLILALKANPNILECLYTPLVEHASPIAQELLAIREAFLSKLIYQTYNGYVASQFRKLEGDLRNRGAIKWKHAMHLIRLLLSGQIALRERRIPVRVDEHRDRLLSVRAGAESWESVDGWRLELHRSFDEAFATTVLPERPDYSAVNDFLIRARRSAL